MIRMIKIAPSILAANPFRLESEIKKVQEAGADLIHIDVMDGHFVPNIAFGPNLVKAIRNITSLPLDIHLMVNNPKSLIPKYLDAGSDAITVHFETLNPQTLALVVKEIKNYGNKAGIALKPETPISKLTSLDVVKNLDLALVMSVSPGFSGQQFLEMSLRKISELKRFIKDNNLRMDIAIDGGINSKVASLVTRSGANILVAGASLFEMSDVKTALGALREEALQGLKPKYAI
jgi:ribulose-phosphate 3-epimerase